MIKDQIKQLITSALDDLNLPKVDFTVEHPTIEAHGDYAVNVALVVFPKLKHNGVGEYQNPRELAQIIVSQILNQVKDYDLVSKVEVAGPGFINFYSSLDCLIKNLQTILTNQKYGHNDTLKGKKVVVEFTDPNPFKEFHVGHLYSNTVGESLSRLYEASGAHVWRADFFGDVGMHAAKSIWGLLEKFKKDSLTLQALEDLNLNQRIEYFGQAYALGATKFETENDPTAQTEIKELNTLIFKAAQEAVLPEYDKTPEINFDQFLHRSRFNYEEIKNIYLKGRQWSLDYFETIYQRLGTKFDGYYPESVTGEYGYHMVKDGVSKGVFQTGEGGAIIFPGKKYGLHDRVFINSLGLPTYETKDFGLLQAKYKDFAYDKSIIVTGNEINEYFKVVLKAMEVYQSELGKITTHIGHGMVRLPEGKMSSRTGKIIRGEWVIEEAKNRVQKILKTSKVVTSKDRESVAEVVAIGAVKYAFLKQGIGADIAFDFDTSLSFEGNSGPYLQYTYARCQSVMAKSKQNVASLITKNFKLKINAEELAILRWLYRYPKVVREAGVQYAPHVVCTYLFELAQRFNSFYNTHSILGSLDYPLTRSIADFRLLLTTATAQVLKNGLSLLGIKAPDKM